MAIDTLMEAMKYEPTANKLTDLLGKIVTDRAKIQSQEKMHSDTLALESEALALEAEEFNRKKIENDRDYQETVKFRNWQREQAKIANSQYEELKDYNRAQKDKEENDERAQTIFNQIERIPSNEAKLERINKLRGLPSMQSNFIQNQFDILETTTTNDTKTRLDEVKTLSELVDMSPETRRMLENSVNNKSMQGFNKDYLEVKNALIGDMDQDKLLIINEVKEINLKIKELYSGIPAAKLADSAAGTTEQTDFLNSSIENLETQKGVKINEFKSLRSPYSNKLRAGILKKIKDNDGLVDRTILEEASEEELDALEDIMSKNKGVLDWKKSEIPSQEQSNVIQAGIIIPDESGVPPSLIGKKLTPNILKKLMRIKNSPMTARTALRGTNPAFNFLDIVAEELGFESAEDLNTEEGYSALIGS